MVNPWFRMYSEFSHDPKIQMMSEQMQRRYVMLMCMRCSNTLVTLHETEVTFHLRISNEEFAETKALFIEKGFIDNDLNLLNWDKRQFVSDTSRARVAKHRMLRKKEQTGKSNIDVTLQKQKSNALDTDTDTEKKVIQGPVGPNVPDWIPLPAWQGYVEMRRRIKKPMTDRAKLLRINDLRRFLDDGHDLTAILDQSTASSWTDLYPPKAKSKTSESRPTDWASRPEWVTRAGFENVADANASRCFSHNANDFHAGKRVEVTA